MIRALWIGEADTAGRDVAHVNVSAEALRALLDAARAGLDGTSRDLPGVEDAWRALDALGR